MNSCRALLAPIFALCAGLLSCTPAHAQLSVQWIAQYGSSAGDIGRAIAVDALGQIWVSGNTQGNLGGTNAGSFTSDLFLSRISAGGSVQFTRQRGGTNDEIGFGVALVGSGTVFAGGYTNSSSLDSQASLGDYDAFSSRFDTSGTFQATRRVGGSSTDYAYDLAGNATNLLIAGQTIGSFDGQTNAQGFDAFLSKRDSSGTLIWTRFAGTSGNDLGQAAAFDSTGNGYLTGYTTGSFPGFSQLGGGDLFIARYDASGTRTLIKELGTTDLDWAYGVEADVSGNIYLTGSTRGNLGGQTNKGGDDAFLMKLDSNGNVLWTKLFGGNGTDVSYGLGLDGAGHVWIGGASDTFNLNGRITAGVNDAFVAEYDTNGNLLGTTWLATGWDEQIYGLTIGSDGNAYVTGWTDGVLAGSNAGSRDVFVAKIVGVVPEPSAALLLVAGAGLLLRRRRG